MGWKFTERVRPERQKYLLDARDFGPIADRIAQEMKILSCTICRGERPELKGSKRPVFRLQISGEAFDLFYNSPGGYRGQYHVSPKNGETANKKLISMMLDNLIAFAKEHVDASSGMTLEMIKCSLNLPSAKIWIDETGVRKQKGEDITNFQHDLDVEPWIRNAKKYLENHTLGLEKAIDGVKAPEGTILEVKGAFVTEKGEERIPKGKKDRSLQIHRYGYT